MRTHAVTACASVGILLILGGCFDDRRPSAAVDAVPRVAVVRAVAAEPAQRAFAATLAPARDVRLGPLRAGAVARIGAAVGEAVAAGDLLVALDARAALADRALADAALREAEAVVAAARRAAGRVAALADGASPAARDEAETAVARAEAQRDAARARAEAAAVAVAHHEARAPFAGVVAAVDTEVGAVVPAGAPLVRLVSAEAAEVQAGLVVDEVEAARAEVLQASVHRGAWQAAATLRELAAAADPRTGQWSATFVVPLEGAGGEPSRPEADAPQAPDGLAPVAPPLGAGVTLRLAVAVPDGAVRLPAEAVRDDHVRVVVDGALARRAVRVVGADARGLVVTGLGPGLDVVVHAPAGVAEGDAVTVVAAAP